MRVTIEASLFQGGGGELELCALLRLGFAERHRILADPLYIAAIPDETHPIHTWLEQLPEGLRQECSLALEIGLEAETRSPSSHGIRIAPVPTSDWDQPPEPVLPLAHAMRLLERPFRVLVENGHNDTAFLLTVSEEGDRRFLEMMVERGWLIFEHTGGTGEMSRRLKRIASNREEARCAWALFDSDRLQPTQASPAIERLRTACRNIVPFHQLDRRFIESYLPIEALVHWAGQNADRRRTVSAFHGLNRAQRNHYHMKNGFNGDSHRRDNLTAGTLYQNLRQPQRRNLAAGFGATVVELFHRPECRVASWYIDDGQQPETNAMIKDLLALL